MLLTSSWESLTTKSRYEWCILYFFFQRWIVGSVSLRQYSPILFNNSFPKLKVCIDCTILDINHVNTNLYYILTHAGGGLGYCHTWLLFTHTQDTTWQQIPKVLFHADFICSFTHIFCVSKTVSICNSLTPSRWGTKTLINHRTGAAWGAIKFNCKMDGLAGIVCCPTTVHILCLDQFYRIHPTFGCP